MGSLLHFICTGNMARLQLAIEGAEELGATDAQLRGARQLLQRRQKRSSSGGSGAPGSGARHAGTPGSRHGARHSKGGPGGSGHGGSAGPFGGSPRPGSAASYRGSSAGGTPRRAADVGTPSPVAAEQMAAPLSGLHAEAEDAATWHVVEAHGKHGGLAALSSGLAVKVPSPASLSADSTPSSSLRISSGAASTDGGDTPGSPPLAARGGSGGMTSSQDREHPPQHLSRQSPPVRGSPSRVPAGSRTGSSPAELGSQACTLPGASRCATPDAPPLLQPVPSVESPVSPLARAARHGPPEGAQLRGQPSPPRPDKPVDAATYSPPGRSGPRSSPPGFPPAPQPPQYTPPPLRPSTGSLPLDSSKWFDDADDGERPAASSLSADFYANGPRATDAVVPGPAYSRPRSGIATTAPPMAGSRAPHPREDRSCVMPAPPSAAPAAAPSAWESALSAFGYGGQTPPPPAHNRGQQGALPPQQQLATAGDDRRSSWRRSLSLSAFQSPPPPAPPPPPPQLPLPAAPSGWGWSGRPSGAAVVAEHPFPRPASPAETGSPSVTSQLSPNAKEFRPEARRPSRLSASHRCGLLPLRGSGLGTTMLKLRNGVWKAARCPLPYTHQGSACRCGLKASIRLVCPSLWRRTSC